MYLVAKAYLTLFTYLQKLGKETTHLKDTTVSPIFPMSV